MLSLISHDHCRRQQTTYLASMKRYNINQLPRLQFVSIMHMTTFILKFASPFLNFLIYCYTAQLTYFTISGLVLREYHQCEDAWHWLWWSCITIHYRYGQREFRIPAVAKVAVRHFFTRTMGLIAQSALRYQSYNIRNSLPRTDQRYLNPSLHFRRTSMVTTVLVPTMGAMLIGSFISSAWVCEKLVESTLWLKQPPKQLGSTVPILCKSIITFISLGTQTNGAWKHW